MLVAIVGHHRIVVMASTAPLTTLVKLAMVTIVTNVQMRLVFAGHARITTELVQTVLARRSMVIVPMLMVQLVTQLDAVTQCMKPIDLCPDSMKLQLVSTGAPGVLLMMCVIRAPVVHAGLTCPLPALKLGTQSNTDLCTNSPSSTLLTATL